MTVILVVFVSLLTILCIVIGLPLFILYMIRNSLQAAKYRSLMNKRKEEIKTGYSVVYKIGRKMETVEVDGITEGEAMQDLIKKGIRYDKIISLTKN